MELYIVFALFLLFMVGSLLFDISMIIPLFMGFLLFNFLAVRKGYKINELKKMIIDSFSDSFIVIGILLLIGCLTGLWRMSGTIAYFVSYGISIIPPSFFILAAFILTGIMSFALGTSYGVTATAGVILISIAKAGNVNLIYAAGAILSGVYIGDRGSPAASSGNLVAVVTHTDMNDNVKRMAKNSILPILICLFIYSGLSLLSPMKNSDVSSINLLNEEFVLEWYCLIPAIIMVVLPLCKVSVRKSMILSIISSILICIFVQNKDIYSILKTMLFGFIPNNLELKEMLSGGGISSMLEVSIILLISGTYGNIFKGTGIIKEVTGKIEELSKLVGRYTTNVILAIVICAVFCNQTIGIIMQNQLNMDLYKEDENKEKMIDIEDSVVLIAGLIPWCIACSVPLAMINASAKAVPFACYLWLLPMIRVFKEQININRKL